MKRVILNKTKNCSHKECNNTAIVHYGVLLKGRDCIRAGFCGLHKHLYRDKEENVILGIYHKGLEEVT